MLIIYFRNIAETEYYFVYIFCWAVKAYFTDCPGQFQGALYNLV